MGADADLQLVADGVAHGAEDGRDMTDRLQRVVARRAGDRRERVELAAGDAAVDQLPRPFAGERRVVPDAGAVQVGVGAELVVVPAAKQVVDRLVRRLADQIPAGHLDRRERRHAVQPGVAVVVQRRLHPLPDLLHVERAFAFHEAVEQVVQQFDLRLQIRRATGDALPQADEPLVRPELDEQPLPVADRRVDVVDQDRLEFGDLHLRRLGVLSQGGGRLPGRGQAGAQAGRRDPRAGEKAASRDHDRRLDSMWLATRRQQRVLAFATSLA